MPAGIPDIWAQLERSDAAAAFIDTNCALPKPMLSMLWASSTPNLRQVTLSGKTERKKLNPECKHNCFSQGKPAETLAAITQKGQCRSQHLPDSQGVCECVLSPSEQTRPDMTGLT